WAIEYGYKPGAKEDELKKIASRAGEPGLWYATDEDTRPIDSDPLSNRFDLGSDPVGYASLRAKQISELWPGLVERVTKEGEGYQDARRAFGVLLGNHGQAVFFASRYVGGVHVNRDHRGDAGNRMPFEVVPAAKQREALALLEEQIFNDKPFQFPPELYNSLASSRWSHWGTTARPRVDIAVHEVIVTWQDRVLAQLLATQTLDRLHDSELKVPADQDAFTSAELLERLTKAIFAEVDSVQSGEFTVRKPAISSLRRNLQRNYLKRLANLAMGNSSAPQDCQTVAFAQLSSLETRIGELLKREAVKLDPYSKAHLTESASRIKKAMDAHLTLSAP
ncbi:MAG: zinc-dependent metalloprotease, partial [Planctomycetia bacterium]|nr:zinc-dependent metalloprotease [Planctomycetia bacterium]